jgi:LPXTG-motif cell wall-anchored protein
MGFRRVAITLITAAVAAGVLAAPAAASCMALPGTLEQRLKQADLVFVGSVTDTQGKGKVAFVNVESVWRGKVPDRATVTGGEGGVSITTSVDREFTKARRYLFVPFDHKGDVFHDNGCTDTQPWKGSFNTLRPAGAKAVSGPPDMGSPDNGSQRIDPDRPGGGSSDTYTWIAAGGVLALLLFGGVFLLRRRSAAAT